MLDSIGLSLPAERLYRAMLAYSDEGVTQLALRLRCSEQEVRDSLSELSALAVVQPSPNEHSGFHAVPPEAAMELLLARQHAELAAQQHRVEASRAAAAQLIAECSALRPRGDSGGSEIVHGADAIRARLAQLGAEAENEVTTLAPGGAHTPEDLEASRGPNATLLDRGVRMRTIYLSSVRNHQPTLDHVGWLHSRGGKVRTTPTLPLRMIILDGRKAVLPLDPADARAGAVILDGQSTLTALCALFESLWAAALPLGDPAPPRGTALPTQESETLRLLAVGLTDEAIAKRLGVSPRTARRIAADLMERLDARSRFEAGVHAVQDGWLPATR
ncbi:helix-turn-helix transcriptional regulator [Streptomyces sp. AC563]|uniref:helix-turn-helix domain-containing protein n=1 Tax=Streptomyces buecherae TaxID=2763006 RepID=UPI00164DEA2B|nr:helix-turn-helix transcriptional regulator [Streptomyces buecherae]MBC3985659.1 helix-turn-helix transcriptional regulator [Streptomyces buecherae]MBC3990331.1 helix-turn-helix transcriptional regulator [Streptomyces buecherae]QNJ39406.1 helix-turn-helix transcriptional regulator [Streptomyces buecherae]